MMGCPAEICHPQILFFLCCLWTCVGTGLCAAFLWLIHHSVLLQNGFELKSAKVGRDISFDLRF